MFLDDELAIDQGCDAIFPLSPPNEAEAKRLRMENFGETATAGVGESNEGADVPLEDEADIAVDVDECMRCNDVYKI